MKKMLIVICLLGAVTARGAQKVAARLEKEAVVVEVDGKLFTAYRFVNRFGKKPYLWPLVGPASGKSVTTESSDPYPHHNSMWFGCDHINGGDYWHHQNPKGKQVSRGPKILVAAGDAVVFEDVCDWQPPEGTPVMHDYRRVTVAAPDAKTRIIDFNIVWVANEKMRITKTNHSLLAMRMTPELSVKGGGTMVNAEGGTGEKGTIGKRAPWMDYFGERGGVTEGAAILQHSSNRWYPSPWFTRDYGFFSPTPMYWLEKGVLELAAGEAISLAYRVVVHEGNTEEAGIAGQFKTYAACTPVLPSGYVASVLDTYLKAVATHEYGESRAPLMAIGDVVCRTSGDPAMRRMTEARLLDLATRTDITRSARDFVCRQLSLVGGKASVPLLKKWLHEADRRRSGMAAYALARIPGEDVMTALRDSLGRVDDATRVEIASALAGRQEAVQDLVHLLAAEGKEVRGAAAYALGRTGGRTATKALFDAWHRDERVRTAELTDALLQACGGLGVDDAREIDAAGICRKVYAEAVGSWQKLGALRALLAADQKAGSALLKTALADNDVQVSAGAARLLTEIPGEDVTRLAVSQLGTMEAAGQEAMLRVLAKRGDRTAAPGVRSFLEAKEEGVRAAAYEAIGVLGRQEDVPTFVGKLPEESAAAALVSLKGAGVPDALIAAFKRSKGEARVALARVLRGRGEPTAAPVLLAVVTDSDEKVAREAIRALGELGGKPQLDTLAKRLNLEMESAARRKGIEGAAAAIAARLGGEGEASALVLAAMRDVSPVGRASLVRILGRLGEDAGLRTVVDAAGSRLPTVADAGVRVLSEWPGDAALAPLLTVAGKTRNETHHVLAMRGYIRLLKGMTDRSPIELKKHYDAGRAAARREEEKAALAFEVKGAVIRDLAVKSKGAYRVHFGGLREGATWSSDREYTFEKVPNEIRGATYIETTMDDRAVGGSDFMSFIVDEPVVVYVGFDNRCRALPGWLKGWERLKESIRPPAKTGCHLVLHRKRFEKGKVTLGGANAPGVSAMYCVAVKESK